jgi:uncharacterized protein YecT (DUF1311 family)
VIYVKPRLQKPSLGIAIPGSIIARIATKFSHLNFTRPARQTFYFSALDVMTRFCLFVLAACFIGCQQYQPRHTTITSDPELQRLTATLERAQTQYDMNLASKKISEFWDEKLTFVEKRVLRKLDNEQQKQYSNSSELWRSYRKHEVQFRSDFFAGGSIRPLIANSSYSQITEHRVIELESIFADALEGKQ